MRRLRRLSVRLPRIVGSPQAFAVAIGLTAAWIVWGAVAGFDTTWLLWPSAIASVVTFLIAFSLQYTQNRDTRAIQLKLDEILRVHAEARRELVKVEERPDEVLAEAERATAALAQPPGRGESPRSA
jgi:low affinity Fe/Cu permease